MSRTSLVRIGGLIVTAALVCLSALSCGRDRDRIGAMPTQPLAASDAAAIPERGTGSGDRIAIFGTKVSYDGATLVLQMPEAVIPEREPPAVRRIPVPGLGDVAGRRVQVSIDDATAVHVQDAALAAVPRGTPVMIAGSVSGDRIQAHLVVDLRLVEASLASLEAPAVPEITGTWRELPPEEAPDLLLPPGFGPSSENTFLEPPAPGSSSETREFKGDIDSPLGVEWSSPSLYIPITAVPGLFLKSIKVKLGVGGGYFDFPFAFDVSSPTPLFMDSDGMVNVQITPENPGGGDYSYYWFQGVWVTLKIAYLFIDYTSVEVGEGQGFEMQDPAPMPGDKIDVPHDECANFDISPIKKLPVFGVRVCLDATFFGEPFGVDTVVVDGATHIPATAEAFHCPKLSGPPEYGLIPEFPFDGAHPQVFSIRPSTNPLGVDLKGFLYRPQRELGMSVELDLLGHVYYNSPTRTITPKNCVRFVPPDKDTCPPPLGSGTCGRNQPKVVSLALPVIPVVTSVTASPYLSRVGDPVVLEALVRGANGPGSSPREVSFYDGDVLLGVAPIDGAEVARLDVSTLSPCRHEIRARFVGVDEEGTAYPSEKSTVALVTGDAAVAGSEGFWQHQLKGNGATEYDPATVTCYLAVAGELSRVFSERRNATAPGPAYDVIFLGQNHGSAMEQLDRELLVAWLNVAAGGLRTTEWVDADRDQVPDTPCLEVLAGAERICLDPLSTESDLLEQVRAVHTMKGVPAPGSGTGERWTGSGDGPGPRTATSRH